VKLLENDSRIHRSLHSENDHRLGTSNREKTTNWLGTPLRLKYCVAIKIISIVNDTNDPLP